MLFLIFNICLILWSLPPTSSEYYHKSCSEETYLLNDGNEIPIVSFGTYTYTVNELDDIPQAVTWAIEAGFRHIDTAAYYIDEDLIGGAITNLTRRGVVKRNELFITTKLSLEANTRQKVVEALKKALKRLQTTYVDLFLIHTPYNVLGLNTFNLTDIWKGMEDAKRLGLAKSIGVSNFQEEHLNIVCRHGTITPAVNEIEVNPTNTNIDLVEYCQRRGIVVMSYAPFGYAVPRPEVTLPPPPSLEDPVLVEIAEKYNVATSQVILRFLVDRGTIPIPRSTNKEHIELNIDIMEFSLTDEEVERINEFNLNKTVYNIPKTYNAKMAELYKERMEYAKRRNPELY